MSEPTITLAEDFNPFDDNAVVPQQVQTQEPKAEEPPIEPKVDEPKIETPEPPKVDYNSFVKETFGFDSVEAAKSEFEKLKSKQEFSFENETSQRLFEAIKEGKEDEVLSVIQQKKTLEKLLNADVTKENALDIVKLNYQTKFGDLTQDEIDLLISDNYKFPDKPVKGEFEEDDEFKVRQSAWESEMDKINRKIVIEAKLAKPELQKLQQEIKLPDLNPQANEDFERDSENLRKAREVYEQTLNSEYQQFDGFKLSVKDGEVEMPITFSVSDEEKSSLKELLSDFNPDDYLSKRWFSEDGRPQIKQIMSDIYLLENQSKILQKVGNEAASQRMLHQLKQSGQISVGTTPQRPVTQSDTAMMDSLAEWAFSS